MRKIIDLAEAWVLKYVDPILLYGVGLLVVAGLSFYGGFQAAADRNRRNETQFTIAVSRACIDYVYALRPRKVSLEASTWISLNCEKIGAKSLIRMRGMNTAEIGVRSFK